VGDAATGPLGNDGTNFLSGAGGRFGETGNDFAILRHVTEPGRTPLAGDGGRSTLATDEEIRAERLAARIAADPAVVAAEAEIVELWRDRLSAKIGALNPQDEALLGAAVTELAFACAQIAANADPARPAVTWVESPPHTWFAMDVPGGRYAADNPDTIYRQIPVDGDSTYRIDGRFVGERPASSVYQAVANPLLPAPIPGGQLDGATLAVRPDGTFTITVGPEPRGAKANHLATNGTAAQVFLRDTLADWAAQTAPALSVRRLTGPPPAPVPAFDQLVDKTVRDLGAAGRQWIDFYIVGVLFQPPVNVVPAPVHSAGIYRSSGHFKLSSDQALVVTVNPADAAYMSVVLYNVWSITPSYWSHQTSLTNAQAVPNHDGTYTFVVAGADPRVRNWLDTTGLEQGTFLVRWQDVPAASATGPARPSVTGSLVDTTDLPQILPTATERITNDQRAEQLRRRGLDFERRVASGAPV
jgi:hypothetical protein